MSQPNREQVIENETKAWQLRCRGWVQTRIAAHLGISQPAISKILKRVELRELKKLTVSVERLKVVQSGQLDHVVEESLDAWHRSKEPRKRAASRDGGSGPGAGGKVTTSEIIERDGDPALLYCSMQALAHQRSLWGLDVSPALREPAASVAQLAKDLLIRASGYEERKAAEATGHPAGDACPDPSRAVSMPIGPEPVQ